MKRFDVGVSEKLQKVMASLGLASRRQSERWILAGRVYVNGERATLGARVKEQDEIAVDGVLLERHRKERHQAQVLIYHKPVGEITTRSDPQGRRTVFTSLPAVSQGRWIAVGRLDIATSGLLLFTTDGLLANQLMHPSAGLEREYRCRVAGHIDGSALKCLTDGIDIDGLSCRFITVVREGGRGLNRWFRVIVNEGRNREVRRLWEAVGGQVSRLIRVRYGALVLPDDLEPGRYLKLAEGEIRELRESVVKNRSAIGSGG